MSAPPAAPAAPAAASAPASPEAAGAPAAGSSPEKPPAAGAPAAPKTDDAEAKRLSGKHWKEIADKNWPNSTEIEKLSEAFKPKVQAFLKVLDDNKVTYEIQTTFRPGGRSYLFKYCLDVAAGKTKPSEVPKETGVDINWDHGDDAKSKAAADEMAKAFRLVGVAAHPTRHTTGDAIDLKLGFGKLAKNKDGVPILTYKVGDKEVTREIEIDDEARIGETAAGKTIANIEGRELSKAGDDFGLKRMIDNDIVHWSSDGK